MQDAILLRGIQWSDRMNDVLKKEHQLYDGAIATQERERLIFTNVYCLDRSVRIRYTFNESGKLKQQRIIFPDANSREILEELKELYGSPTTILGSRVTWHLGEAGIIFESNSTKSCTLQISRRN